MASRIICTLLLVGLTHPLFADAKGEAVLKQAFQKLGTAKTCVVDIAATIKLPNRPAMAYRGTAKAMKPNFLRVEMKGPNTRSFVADGKSYYTYISGAPVYFKQPLPSKPAEFLGIWEGEIDAFFGGAGNVSKVVATYGGSAKVGGVDCDIVKAAIKGQNRTIIYAIGKADRLIRRAVIPVPLANRQMAVQTNVMSNYRLNAPLKPADFTFKPPANVREISPRQRPNVRPGIS